MSELRILIVAEGRYPDFVGGTETVIRHLSRELTERGHEVHMLTRKPRQGLPNYEFVDRVHVHRYPGPPVGSRFYWLYPAFSFLKARSCFIKLSDQILFDQIIFNHSFPALGVLSSARCAGISKVYIFHSASHLELRAAVSRDGTLWDASLSLPMACVRRVERYALRKCEAIVTLSRYMQDRVVRFHGEAVQCIKVIPGGVDTKVFTPMHEPEAKRHLREELGVPPNDFVLFAAKRMYRGMGLENLIDAVGLLAAKEPKVCVCLLLAGDGPLRQSLESHIDHEGLGDRVRVLGNVPYHKMTSYYQLADLFISTRAEPFGLVILEALACGLPVLSVPVGGAVEILEKLSKNLLFQDTSSAAMADLILKCLDSPEELAVLRPECRRYVEDNYTWSIAGERMEQLLSQLEVT